MKRPVWSEPTWEIRWNEDKTEGEIWRIKNWPHYPEAPAKEGTIRMGAKP